MNVFEKSAQFGRDMFEINTDTVRKITELSAENLKKYMELNQDFLQKLPEIREVGSFVELQRSYGETLWKGVQEDLKARSEIFRNAVEETSGVYRSAFTTAVDESAKAAKKTASRSASA